MKNSFHDNSNLNKDKPQRSTNSTFYGQYSDPRSPPDNSLLHVD